MAEIRNLTRNGETFYPLTHEKAVIGMEDFKDTITTQISQYQPIEITGDVTNAPDEEDITSDANNLLKFKNRNNLYGLGKVILRRGSSFASQVTQANTIYVIQYNFNLDSGRVNIPNGSILLFEGGTLSNGTLVCADLYDVRLVYYQDVTEILSSVTLEGNFIHKACDKDTIREILVDNSSITKDVNDVLSVKANGIQNSHLNSSTVDNSTITLDSNNKISIKDGGVTGNKLNSGIVNTDDLSIVSNKIQLADRGTTNGMGMIILRKDLSFASQLTQTNTIYVIRHDFSLTSNVTIPANSILKFEGGSLSGEVTITGQDTYIIAPWIGVFYDTLVFAGTWNIEKVVANWFISQNDSAMFNAAIIFAATIAENTWPDYNRVKVEVICVTKTYELTDTIRVSCKVNFNGNQATFWAKSDLYHKYAFMIHYNSDGTPSSFIPGAEGLWFGNFTFYNHNTGAYMAKVNDGRHIRDIKVFDGYKNIIVYSDNYLDQRKISRVVVEGGKTQETVDYSSMSAFRECSSIYISLGDNCILEDVCCDVYIAAGATVKVNGFMGTIAAKNCFVSIENAHTEAEPLLLVDEGATVSVKSYQGWRPKLCDFEYNIKSFAAWDTPTPTINLEDVRICLLSTSRTSIDTDPDYDSYRLVKGQCLITTKNVFTSLPLCFRSDTSGDIYGYTGGLLMLPKRPYGNGYLQNGELYEKEKNNSLIKIEPLSGTFDRVDLHANQSGTTGISIRFVFLADTDAMLVLHKTDIVISSGTTKATFGFNGAFEPPVGTIIRVEIGATPNAYTHYYDIPVGLLATNGIFTEIVNGTPVVGTMDCTPIDYTDSDYIKVFSYEKHNYRNVVLDSSVLTLPSATKFNEGDVVSLYNGKRNRNINNTWVEI